MAGPVWPGGPADTPCVVDLAGRRYTVAAVPGLRLAFAVARGVMVVPDLLQPGDKDAVYARMTDPVDPLDWGDVERATVAVVAALAGVRSGVNGWRAALRLCHGLVSDWPHSGGALMDLGVAVRSAPLWELCAGMYWQFVDNPQGKPDDVKRAKLQLFAPLEGEPAWMQETKPPPPLAKGEAKAGAMALFARANGGAAPKIPGRCDQCGRLGGHAADCEFNAARGRGVAPCRACGGVGVHKRGCPRGMASGGGLRAPRRGGPRQPDTGRVWS